MSAPPRTPGGGQPRLGFTFDGRRIDHRPGQTVGAALVEHGILAWRTTRHEGRPRGLFCGIGICFDCLVTVDGAPNQRACVVLADEVTTVTTQSGSGREPLEASTVPTPKGSVRDPLEITEPADD